MTERVEGLASAGRFIEGMPAAAAHELADRLGRIGRDLLATQKATVARATGALQGKLSVQLLTERLRVRVGLMGIKNRRRSRQTGRAVRNLEDAFYGRIVEEGRKAQTVVVTRHLKRRVTGNGRQSKRTVTYEGKPYKLRVAAMAGRPFVRFAGWEQRADAQLADYWAGVLARGGSAA